MLRKLNLTAFVVAFSAGLLFIYLFTPPPEVVVKFPTPWNAGHVVYREPGSSDACYVVRATNETCPADKALIRPQPVFSAFTAA